MRTVLSFVLALIGATFAIIGTIDTVRKIKISVAWPKVDAVVDQIDFSPLGDNPLGAARLKLRYVDDGVERAAWAYKFLLPGQDKIFTHEYAIGTRHLVSLNPSARQQAELELGWNSQTMFVPMFLLIVCACLLTAARYFWRSEQRTRIPPIE